MKKLWLFLIASALATGWIATGEAVVIRMDGTGLVMTSRQPLEVIVTDSNGNVYRQMAYYDSTVGGINLDINGIGSNASIYFPALGMGYIWYNGYWVDQQGYYWDGTRRVYVNDPNWNNYWGGYWRGHRYADWHGRRDEGWRRDEWRDGKRDWRRDDWRRGEGDWRGRDDGWRRGSWKDRDDDNDGHQRSWRSRGDEGRQDEWRGRGPGGMQTDEMRNKSFDHGQVGATRGGDKFDGGRVGGRRDGDSKSMGQESGGRGRDR